MNPVNSINDDDIDALLRASFDGPVQDNGFCDRVLPQLPPRRRRSAWPLVTGVLVGAALCAVSLFTSPLWSTAWQGWLVGEWSTSSLITLGMTAAMSLLALVWTFAEADDH
jgi:hypothetical protein